MLISNVSGSIDVRGWDRNEVKVTGDIGEDVERVDVETTGGRTVIKVVVPHGGSHDSEATLEVQVPSMSSVEVSAVSADVSSRGVLGTQRIKTVSGEINADVAGDNSEVRSVSGDISAHGAGKPVALRISSVSGSINLSNAAGKLDAVTVSGDARLQLGEVSEVRGRTTSGTFELRGQLAADGRVDVEAVSGDITLAPDVRRRLLHGDRILQRRHYRLPGDLGRACQQVRTWHAAHDPHRRIRRACPRQDAVGRHRDLQQVIPG